MQISHEKGLAIHSAPSFALCAARRAVKRKQGNRWAGYGASKMCNQDADALDPAEGNTLRVASARPGAVLRSPRPQTRLDTLCTRTGRPRRCPSLGRTGGRRLRLYGPHARLGGVGQRHSTDETLEQGPQTVCGECGGKAAGQGEHPLASHVPDTERGFLSRVPRATGCTENARALSVIHPRQEPYALASARTDPCGGRSAMVVPTATPRIRPPLPPPYPRRGIPGLPSSDEEGLGVA